MLKCARWRGLPIEIVGLLEKRAEARAGSQQAIKILPVKRAA